MNMAVDAKALGIHRMSVEERRLADAEANPDDVVSWDEIKVQALARIGR
jgi:hypothetical protein